MGLDPTLALAQLWRERRTGVLECAAEGVTTCVWVHQGTVVFAEAGSIADSFGRVLVREGMLTDEQYATVIERMTDGLVSSEDLRFGEVAVQLGILAPETVEQALGLQVRAKAVRCQQHADTRCDFDEDADGVARVAQFPNDTRLVVFDGVHRYWDPMRADALLARLGTGPVSMRHAAAQVTTAFSLQPPQTRFLESIDGRRSAEALVEGAPIDSVLSRQLLCALALAGVVEIAAAPAASRPAPSAKPGSDPSRRVPPELRPQTGSDPSRRVPPELRGEPAGADDPRAVAMRRAAQLAMQLGKKPPSAAPPAELTRSGHRRPVDAHRAELDAERAFLAGKRHVRVGAWAHAAREFSIAAERRSDAPEYEIAALYAQLRAASTDADRERMGERLGPLVAQALKKDRDLALAHHVQGYLRMVEGDDVKAEASFRQAVKLDAEDLEAARWIRLIQGRR